MLLKLTTKLKKEKEILDVLDFSSLLAQLFLNIEKKENKKF